MSRLNVSFVVQGEGRGHMTQALALAAFLRDAGHDVGRVMVGRSPYRSIPSYFREGVQAEVEEFEAPTQVPGADGKALSVSKTLLDAARRSPAFMRSMVQIAEGTAGSDVIVNFLDLMGGASRKLFPAGVPGVAIAHNYVFLHPALEGAPGPETMRRSTLAYARATTAGSNSVLALSFDELPPAPDLGLRIVPPLLRPGLDRFDVSDGDHLLAYALNPGYGAEIASWSESRPDTEVHCFLDGGRAALPVPIPPSLHVHPLGERTFLEQLASCRAYVGSAGFESICEAHYFGKPVLAVPTTGQFEQTLNAWDAERVGAAQAGVYSDLDSFWDGLETAEPASRSAFQAWVDRAPTMLVEEIERAARNGRESPSGRVG
jgi:uncharacterized protein (TIGR00661 family)